MAKSNIYIKRSKVDYLSYAVVLLLFSKGVSAIDSKSIEIIDIVNVIGVVVVLSVLVRIIINPNLLSIDSTDVILFKALFYQVKIPISNIQSIEEKVGFVTRVYIITRDGKKVNISSTPLKDKDLSLLKGFINSN